MTVRKLQGDGDIATQGVQFLYDVDDFMQTLKTRLNLFYGEYFRDINEGTQWYEQILSKGSQQQVKDAEIQRRIQGFADTMAMVQYESSFEKGDRKYTVRAQVQTSAGIGDFTLEDEI